MRACCLPKVWSAAYVLVERRGGAYACTCGFEPMAALLLLAVSSGSVKEARCRSSMRCYCRFIDGSCCRNCSRRGRAGLIRDGGLFGHTLGAALSHSGAVRAAQGRPGREGVWNLHASGMEALAADAALHHGSAQDSRLAPGSSTLHTSSRAPHHSKRGSPSAAQQWWVISLQPCAARTEAGLQA